MLTQINTMQLEGVEPVPVMAEIDVSSGLPNFTIVGQADLTVKESKERIRIAINSSGCLYPMTRITVNLCPADARKRGSHFDLAIAVGILVSSGQLPQKCQEYAFLGELSLDGTLAKTKGILPMVKGLKQQGIKKVFVPFDNRKEAAFVSGISVFPASNLKEVIAHFYNKARIMPVVAVSPYDDADRGFDVDFAEVKGQEEAKRAIMISVAGNHGLFMVGNPGSGKTMLAERIPTVLPLMTPEDIIEATTVYSVAGLLDREHPLVSKPPFRQPHYKITQAGLIGGGKYPAPGEITLAHKGVLFLDEIGEFAGGILESLRTPLENKSIVITRSLGNVTYPCDCLFIAASNPCKCGYYGSSTNECICTAEQILNYQRKFSGPIIERIDMHISVPEVDYESLQADVGLSSLQMRNEIQRVRDIQKKRYINESFSLNSQLKAGNIDTYAYLGEEESAFIQKAYTKFRLNPRTLMRVRKVARTIADLDGEEEIRIRHIAESLKFRGATIYDK